MSYVQRWRQHRDSYRPAGEPIDPRLYGVEPIDDDATAKAFVVKHHYSARYPAARARVGLYRHRRHQPTELVGVAVFGVQWGKVLRRWCGEAEAVELARFVLLDDVPANGETWFLARAFALLPSLLGDTRAVLAYSDPVPRRSQDGSVVMPGHYGTIYQAHNARYCGRSRAMPFHVAANGTEIHKRLLDKVRREEQGYDYAYQRLLDCGAPRRRRGEGGHEYVRRALEVGPFRACRHPGKHAYVWAVGDSRRATRRALPCAPLAYPKPPRQLALI